MSKDILEEFCDANFGPGGKVSVAYAESEGNAMFEEFLKEMKAVPNTNAYKAEILNNALARRYHDYEGNLMKLGLVYDLTRAGLEALATRTRNGDFDF